MRAPAVVAQDQLASLQSADDFARYMREHGVLDGEVRIAHGAVSRTAWYRARRGMPHKVLTGMHGAGTAGRTGTYLPGVNFVCVCF